MPTAKQDLVRARRGRSRVKWPTIIKYAFCGCIMYWPIDFGADRVEDTYCNSCQGFNEEGYLHHYGG